MRNFSNLSKIVSFTVILFTTYTFEVFAQPQYTTPTQRKVQSPQERKQQLEQEAGTAMTEVDATYKEVMAYVNSAQTPPDSNIRGFLKIVAKNRKYLPVLNDSQKATYDILSAWVYYFDNKPDKALKQAALGQKAVPQNQNIIKTRLALSVIYKDYASVIETLTGQNTNKSTALKTGKTDSQSYQQSTEDDLQLDVNAVRIELLGKLFDSNPLPVDANLTSWKSAGQLTCALLWKIDANEFDSFTPVETVETNEPNNTLLNELNLSLPSSSEPLAALPPEQTPPLQYTEFSQLQSLFADDKKTLFVGLNLNDPAKKRNLENWLSKNPQSWPTFLLPEDQRQKMLSGLVGGSNKPLLLIIAPDSTIRYVGDANGFLPQMIIHNILANPQELVEPNEPNHPALTAESNQPVVESPKPAPLPLQPNSPLQTLTPDVNETAINTQQPQTQPQTTTNTASAPVKQKVDEDFSAADDYQAETLLSNARTFLKIGNRLPSHEYRNPIEWCRKVMKDYPNTKYAQEAQMLLRNVPEEHRQQYNLTNEELGL